MTKKDKGKGWHGDPEGHAKAGKKGGKITARTHGREFYEKIGRKGGKMSPGKFKEGSRRAREAGRKGGRASGL